jgi:hypothetical protein
MEKDKSRALPFIRSLGALPFTSSLIQAHALVRLTRTLCLVCLTQTRTVLYVIVCTCMCIHLYVYMYVCMHVRKHACTYECICHIWRTFFKGNIVQEVEAYSGACTFLGVHVCMCVCVGLCVSSLTVCIHSFAGHLRTCCK